jgi:putative inorganic carbon (HCO3(-)) transporter
MARAHPWLGVGLGGYEIAYPDYRLINWHEPLGHAHNYYLNILAEGGIIGLLAYGKVWLLIIWLTWRVRSHPDNLSRLTAIGILGTWTYLGIHSLFDNLYVNNLFIHIGTILGILGVLYNQVIGHVKLRLE